MSVLDAYVVQAIEISFRCNETNSWHENEAFIRSLSRRGRYSPKSMFDSAKEKFPDSPSKMIPELKFVFWQKMRKHPANTALPSDPISLNLVPT